MSILIFGRNKDNNKVNSLNITDDGELKTVSPKITNNVTVLTNHSVGSYSTYTSSAIDMSDYKNIFFFGTTSNTMDSIYFDLSNDNVNWYRYSQTSMYPDFNTGDLFGNVTNYAFKYIRFYINNQQQSSHTYTINYTQMK